MEDFPRHLTEFEEERQTMSPISPKPFEVEDPKRGKRLGWMIVSLGSAIALFLMVIGFIYYLSPTWMSKKENWVEIGSISGITGSDPQRRFYRQRVKDGWTTVEKYGSVWLVKENGKLLAFNPHCPHLGCPFRWDEGSQKFQCPCHGGVFDKLGRVVSGPPPRPLDQYSVKVEKGTVSILPVEE